MSDYHQVQRAIEAKLIEHLTPSFLSVENESHMHSVPPNSETHFKVVVVSEQFEGLRPVKRQQMIYKILADEIAGPVHALAQHTYSPMQWAQKNGETPDSPNCLGKGA